MVVTLDSYRCEASCPYVTSIGVIVDVAATSGCVSFDCCSLTLLNVFFNDGSLGDQFCETPNQEGTNMLSNSMI